MSKLTVIAKIQAKEGKGDELVAAIHGYVPALASEDGTEVYSINREKDNGDVIWFFEQYSDDDALKTHMGSPAFAEFGGSLGGLLAGAPEIIMTTPVFAKGTP